MYKIIIHSYIVYTINTNTPKNTMSTDREKTLVPKKYYKNKLRSNIPRKYLYKIPYIKQIGTKNIQI